MIMELHYWRSGVEFYDVKAETQEEAKEKMNVYLKKENCGTLDGCYSVHFPKPEGDVTYITENSP